MYYGQLYFLLISFIALAIPSHACRLNWSYRFRVFGFCVCIFCNTLSADHKEGEIIVRYTDGTTDFEKNKTAVQFELTFKKSFKLTNSALYSFDANQSLGDLKKKLEKLSSVKYVSENKIYRKQSYDPFFGYQWYLDNTGQTIRYISGNANIDIGWKDAIGRYRKQNNTYVAVLDSGFARDHPELQGRLAISTAESTGTLGVDDDNNNYRDDEIGWDFIDNDNDPYDFRGHGTQVAAIIAGATNGVGIQGISQDAYIRPIRVLNRDGTGSTSHLLEALQYIYENPGIRIINLSLGGPSYDRILEEAFKAFEKDNQVLIVAAAGNGGDDGRGDDNDQKPYYPSSYDSSSVISVASINSKGDLSSFSNYGQDSVDIAAPGNNIVVATVERISVPSLATEADGGVWREELWWLDSISKTWERNLYGSSYWLESPRNYSGYSSLTSPSFDLSQRYDPRVKITLDFELAFGGNVYLMVSRDSMNWTTLEKFTSYSTGGGQVFEFDVSKWVGDDSVWLKFDFFPKSNLEYFDVGPIRIEDVSSQAWSGTPYYDFAQGTSFAAPVVSGVASLVMSHRPDLLASDVKEILMNSVQSLNSLSNKVKSGGIVRADKALELADTYRKRSSVNFAPTYNQKLTSDLKVKVNDIYLTNQEMTAGLLDGQGDYFEGDSIILKAIPAIGFNFEGWEESGEIISTNETFTFISEFKDYTFKAKFIEDLSDPDNDEFPNYAEALYGTDIGNPNTDNDALNDYDEWQVGWYGSSLRLLEDDSATISLLEDILGEDSYKKGELAGIEKGKTSVTTDPYAYNLVKKSSYDQALQDANASAEQSIADAKVLAKAEGIDEGKTLGKSEGESSVTSNPSLYNLVTKTSYDQALQDANASAEQAIADAKVLAKAKGIDEGKTLGKSEGETSVTSNPSAYNLVTQSAYDEMMNELMSASNADTTPYNEGWFYLPNQGWLWTTRTTYPYFYDSTTKAWMYFQSGNDMPKFYHYGTKEWMSVE